MKILKWMIALPFIALALFVLARFALCRPSYSVVKTATPMVEKMADYIVKHGMPDSLDQIPDLPHELNGCKRKIVYWNGHDIVKERKDTEWIEIKETCNFSNKGKIFSVNLRLTKFVNKIFDDGELDIKSEKTSVGISFKLDEHNDLIHYDIGTSFDNRFGFCRQFKQ